MVDSEVTYQIALTVGVFDMLHEGHVNLFERMKGRAKSLHVIVHDDFSTFINKRRFPIQSFNHRMRNVANFATVSGTAFPDPTNDIAGVLHRYREAHGDIVFIRGDDWKDFPGSQFLVEEGIPIEFISYTNNISSTHRRDTL